VSSRLFRTAACWVFFAALAYAPWAYGGTTVESIAAINGLLAAVLVLWIVDLGVNRRLPQFPRLLLILIAALLLIGGWMAFNAVAIFDSTFETFTRLRRPMPRLPGSMDYTLSVAWMIRAALLLGVALFIVDLLQDKRWLLRVWAAIAIVGGSVALLGLLQKASGARMMFWQPAPPGEVSTFFASYYYHGNAGAYLNLVLPLAVGLAFRSFVTRANAGAHALWLTVAVLTLIAVFANTARAAQPIAVVLLLGVCVRVGPRLVHRFSRGEKHIALIGALAILLALFALARVSHLEQPIGRWKLAREEFSADARWRCAAVAVKSLPEAGLFGFGPGTFRAVFPSFNLASPRPVSGDWRFLHDDYLQTLMEWGWLGAALWAVLFFGGMIIAIRRLNSSEAATWLPRRRLVLALVLIALGGVAVYAVVDFPLQIASIQLYVATYVGICWSSACWRSERSDGQRSHLTRPIADN
jgi:hypothetical protein